MHHWTLQRCQGDCWPVGVRRGIVVCTESFTKLYYLLICPHLQNCHWLRGSWEVSGVSVKCSFCQFNGQWWNNPECLGEKHKFYFLEIYVFLTCFRSIDWSIIKSKYLLLPTNQLLFLSSCSNSKWKCSKSKQFHCPGSNGQSSQQVSDVGLHSSTSKCTAVCPSSFQHVSWKSGV